MEDKPKKPVFKMGSFSNGIPKKRSAFGLGRNQYKNLGQSGEWYSIISYLKTCDDIRKSLCGNCGVSAIYDKNDKRYTVTRNHTLEEVKTIVEQIRKINSDGVDQA